MGQARIRICYKTITSPYPTESSNAGIWLVNWWHACPKKCQNIFLAAKFSSKESARKANLAEMRLVSGEFQHIILDCFAITRYHVFSCTGAPTQVLVNQPFHWIYCQHCYHGYCAVWRTSLDWYWRWIYFTWCSLTIQFEEEGHKLIGFMLWVQCSWRLCLKEQNMLISLDSWIEVYKHNW